MTDQARRWILASLMMTTMLAAMDTTIVSTAIAPIVRDLGGFEKFSWVFSIYLLTQTLTIPLYGKMADLFGRKSVLNVGITIFLLGSATSALSWNIESLIVFRGLQGLGAGSIIATVNTIAGDLYGIRDRAKIQGLLGSIWGMSAILGPLIGGALAEYANWRWIFLVNLPIGIVAILLLTCFFRERTEKRSVSIDYAGAALLLLLVGLLIVYLLETGRNWALVSPMGLGMPIAILALGVAVWRVEARAADPILPAWLFRDRVFSINSLAMLAMGIVLMGPEAFLPTYTQISLGTSVIVSGLILAGMSLGWPTASALSGHVYMKIGFRRTSLLGTFIFTVACGIFLLMQWPQSPWMLSLDQILLGAGFGLLSTSTIVGIQARVSWDKRGVATGAIIFARNLGQTVGAAIFGAIFNHTYQTETRQIITDRPIGIDDLLTTLHDPLLSQSLRQTLQKAVHVAMDHVYYGLVLLGLITFICLWFLPERGIPEESLPEPS